MTVRRLPRVAPFEGEDLEPIDDDHPMRWVAREISFNPEGWTPSIATKVRELFDQLAGEWHTRDRPDRLVPIRDALDRGGPFTEGLAVELGSGTGIASRVIETRLAQLVAVDLSMEMLRLAPDSVPRVRADGASLPFRNQALATLVLVNMFLFPYEVDRVLAPHGAVVWINTLGPNTPIYLSAEDVDSALPGEWDLTASEAGRGTWCVARRASRR
jgi:SAM-dependent methyltransferase